jgi:hypothetical protein
MHERQRHSSQNFSGFEDAPKVDLLTGMVDKYLERLNMTKIPWSNFRIRLRASSQYSRYFLRKE